MVNTLSAVLLEAISNISHELAVMENAIDAEAALASGDRHALKGFVERMFADTDTLSEWLSHQRLDRPTS
jgi:hypothetical protein